MNFYIFYYSVEKSVRNHLFANFIDLSLDFSVDQKFACGLS